MTYDKLQEWWSTKGLGLELVDPELLIEVDEDRWLWDIEKLRIRFDAKVYHAPPPQLQEQSRTLLSTKGQKLSASNHIDI